MHAAFFGRARLPPPSARASVLALGYGARAWRASYRLVALVVELVVGHVVGADVVPHLVIRPIGQGSELYDTSVVVIDFDFADVRARRPLVAPESRDPCAVVHQGAAQWQHLAPLAA